MEKKTFVSPTTTVSKTLIRASILAGSNAVATRTSNGGFSLDGQEHTQENVAEARKASLVNFD